MNKQKVKIIKVSSTLCFFSIIISCQLFLLDQTAGVEANDVQTDIEILANDNDKQLV